MKTFSIILSLTLAAVSVSAAPRGSGQQQQQQGSASKNGAGAANAQVASTVAVEANAVSTSAAASATNAAADNATSGTAASNTTSTGASTSASDSTSSTATITATGSLSTDSITTNATENNPDPQSSLTLDPRVLASGFSNNGQSVQEAGQVASLTSNNNFINYCLTQNFPITNGLQTTTGSCNPAPIGTIPAVGNMPSSKFSNPANGATLPANQAFTISMNVQNLDTGNFVNADENYFAAPQQLNAQGLIVGHTHVVIEAINGLGDTTPTNPQTFAFFKGVNTAAVNGAVTADVTSGVPAGTYRLCSINSSSNHQPVIVPVAQHGGLDDCVYFTSSGDGATASNTTSATATDAASANSTAAGAASSAAAGAAAGAASSAAAGAASSSAAGAAGAASSAAAGAGAAAGAAGAAAAQPAVASAAPAKAGAAATQAKTGAAANQAKAGKGRRMMYSRAVF